MFGSQILVAPLLEDGSSRTCYLPEGKWIDYQTGKKYDGGYRKIEAGHIPCVILVRDGSLIPTVPVAQSTDKIDWNKITWKPFKDQAAECTGYLFKPGDKEITVVKQ